MPAYEFSEEAVRQLRRLFRDFYSSARKKESLRKRTSGQRNLWAILDEDLFPADNSISEPATATASVQAIDGDDDLYDTGKNITVVNRFESIGIATGTLIKVEWLHGEWSPYASDCPAISSTGDVGGGLASTGA